MEDSFTAARPRRDGRDGRERRDGRPTADARIPPHNLAAEEAVLGALLLSREALGSVVEAGLRYDDFYKPAHQHIYDVACAVSQSGGPADTITVADELRRLGLLDAVGGVETLHRLQNATPAISNAAHYARIVADAAMLRRLIMVAGDISELAYSGPENVDQALDDAETRVFKVADRRVADTYAEIGHLMKDAIDRIEENYARGDTITGTATGYADLDELLSGLQPSTLNIIGARPAMGKTAFGLGMATHIAKTTNRPVLVFSLEMGHVELTQRILSSEAEVDSTKIRNGRLSESDWAKIGRAVGRLEVPLFLDDNPRVTVMEIRAKARRLKMQRGDLAMIMIDYLQLMSGGGNAENRQLEVSEISRNLKILARELEVPIVALSQLSRNLESRADKKPMLSDLRESGCLTASTRLLRADTNTEVTLGDLVSSGARDVPVWSLDEHYRLVPSTLTHAFPSGVQPVVRMTLATGRTIEATANHRFRTVNGWTALGDLELGSRIAIPRQLDGPTSVQRIDDDELILLAHLLGDGRVLPREPVHYTSADPANLDAVERAALRRFGIEARRVVQGNSWHAYLPAPHRTGRGRRSPLMAWWEGLGLRGARSCSKFVPAAVFSSSREQVVLFLRHLWATDGSFSLFRSGPPVRLYYSSSSRQLVDGVAQLLLRLGIVGRLTIVRERTGREGYQLCIEGSSQQRRFLSEVGIFGRRGERIPDALSLLRTTKSNPNADTIPHEVRSRILAAMGRRGLTHRQLAQELGEAYCGGCLLGDANRPRSSSRERLGRIATVTGDKELAELATSDLWWDRVVSLQPIGEQPVFDATVLGTHNFIANGVIAHNSLEQDADVVMFLYRDEVYNKESSDRGAADLIVAKHRAGPIGDMRLVFRGQYARFDNAAPRSMG
jgi:replicative DNA helicase